MSVSIERDPNDAGKAAGRRLLVLGPGYCARRFITGYGAGYDAVAATVRAGRAADLPPAIAPVPFSGRADAAFTAAVTSATDILATAAPDEATGDPFVAATRDALGAKGGGTTVVYLSTVGVYGDRQGGWVDATVPPAPANPRSRRRVDAEDAWQALAQNSGAALIILRLPGIYGPGRSALDDVRDGSARRINKPGQVFNRIHVDDIAAAIAAAFRYRQSGIFDIVDDYPTPPQEVVTYAAGLAGVEPPPEVDFANAPLSPMGLSFYSESKRVSNARAKSDLGWRPAYPSYREGLAAIAAAERSVGQ